MNSIEFEAAREKERIKSELRTIRDELLRRVQAAKEQRAERESRKTLAKQTPDVPSKPEKDNTKPDKSEIKSKKSVKKSKKEKKTKKSKSKSKKKNKRKHTSESDSTSSDEGSKTKKSKKRTSTDGSSSSSTESSEGKEKEQKERTEKVESKSNLVRDDWMTAPLQLKTFSKSDNKPTKEKPRLDSYNPGTSGRELNPYWKNGGTGLPSYESQDEDIEDLNTTYVEKPSSNWKKRKPVAASLRVRRTPSTDSEYDSGKEKDKHDTPDTSLSSTSLYLTDQQMNDIGAKIIKAELVGNKELAEELKKKLEASRSLRQKANQDKNKKSKESDNEPILLTTTDHKGDSRPLFHRSEKESSHGSRSSRKQKGKRVETHVGSERARYFPDDDKYDIKQMFAREKYSTAADSDAKFVEAVSKVKNQHDDLDDIFTDKIRRDTAGRDGSAREKQRAIADHEKLTKTLNNCDKCFESPKMERQLLVAMGRNVYLALPWHEGLQPNHCLIIPLRHVSCSTQLDEDVWSEVYDFRRALTRMFAKHKQDVIFFETARYLHKRNHMVIQCIPMSDAEMAPFYFKKAIQESEQEWATNKQLITLKDKDLRRCIPKGLPYFWVHFGTDMGFAHVIEDQERFPSTFAQEVIGGLLELNPTKWRCPRREQNTNSKVKNFSDWWKPYDCTK